jgi:Tol biopolymer transport system component
MRKLIVLGLLAGLALAALFALPAAAKPAGVNGQIVFGRFDPSLGGTVFYTINPNGTHEQQVLPDADVPLECPHWSPDGTRIASCGDPSGGASRIINPDDGSYRILPNPDPANFSILACWVWSPEGARLACEGFGISDPSLNGIYTVRSADGGGLTRMTSNPGGDDNPGDYSPEGRRFVFGRSDENGDPVGLFVVNVNGTGLKQITQGTLFSSTGDWSPQGNEIVFSQHVTPDVRNSLWIVHADGSGLHEIQVQGVACGGAYSDPSSDSCLEPRWSPDGKKIVFDIFNAATGQRNIYTANADGSGLFQVTHALSSVLGEGDQFPDWGTHPLAG